MAGGEQLWSVYLNLKAVLPVIDWLDLFASPLPERWEMLPIAGRSDSLCCIKTCSPAAKELREERPSSRKALGPVVLKNQF